MVRFEYSPFNTGTSAHGGGLGMLCETMQKYAKLCITAFPYGTACLIESDWTRLKGSCDVVEPPFICILPRPCLSLRFSNLFIHKVSVFIGGLCPSPTQWCVQAESTAPWPCLVC